MLNKLKKFLAPPIFEDEDKTRAAQYINTTTITGAIFLVLLMLSGTFYAEINAVFFSIAVLFLILRYALFQGYVQLAGTILIIATWGGMTYLAWIGDGARDLAMIVYIFLGLLSSLFVSARMSIGLTIISTISLWILFFAQATGHLEPVSDDLITNVLSTTALYIVFEAIIYSTISNSNKTILRVKKSERELLARNEKLEELQNELQEYTSELEKRTDEIRIQANRLQIISEVSQAITLTQNLETLLDEIAERISDGFGFYHVGVFSFENDKRFLHLRATNSDGGKKMIANGYKLELTSEDIVAKAAKDGKPHSAIKSEESNSYFTSNPDLPQTWAKIAFPLKVGNKTLGVLDIQSSKERGFSDNETDAFQSLANQVAIAIENASQAEITQAALEEARATSSQYIHQEWAKLESAKKQLSYRYAGKSISPLEDNPSPKSIEDTLSIPVQVHDQTIGFIEIRREKNKKELNAEEQELVQAIVERTALSLENARLLENSQRLVAKEQVIGNISSKFGETTDIERLMQVAVSELRDALGASEVVLEIDELKNKSNE